MSTTILRKPYLHQFNIAEHVEYHKLAYPIFYEYQSVIQAPALLTAYHDKVTQEETIYKWIRRSEYTEKKAEADHARDGAYLGLEGIVRANLRSTNIKVRDAATHIDTLLESYGDLTHAGYDSETASIDSIVTRLLSPAYTASVSDLSLSPWVNELQMLNDVFKGYVDDTAQEELDKPTISPRTSRNETDFALRQITDHVTSLINLNGQATFDPLIAEFNRLTNHYNNLVQEHYGRLHAKIDITPALIAPIGLQPFAGKPVYVIPEVSLAVTDQEGVTTIVELVFTEDFTVSYQNNKAPGTAILTIHGIGKYTGDAVLRFNIGDPV
jgi:hypothetical protein